MRDDRALTSADVMQTDLTQPLSQRINPHNLIDLGFLDRPTGLPNLRVYVEYYKPGMLDDLFTFVPKVADGESIPKNFTAIVKGKDVDLIFPESPFANDELDSQMNVADPKASLQAMVIRIIITWGESGAVKPFRHELITARRK